MGLGNTNTCLRALLIVTITSALTACATGFVKKNAEDRNAHFAVAASVPAGLPIQTVGTTIFQNSERTLDVPDWTLDRHLSQAAVGLLLKAGGKAAVVPKTLAERLDHIDDSLWSGDPKVPKELAAAVQEETGASRLLLIQVRPIGDEFFDTGVLLKGVGRYQRSRFGRREAVNYIAATVYKVDLATAKTLHWRVCSMVTSRDVEPWFEEDSHVSVQYQKKLEKEIEQGGKNCLDNALAEMGLLSVNNSN